MKTGGCYACLRVHPLGTLSFSTSESRGGEINIFVAYAATPLFLDRPFSILAIYEPSF